jgi:tetratricopeptide (TPR) repeat protein
MARALVAAMNIKVSDEELQLLRTPPTSNVYAYMAYLRGRSMMRHPNLYPVTAVIQTLGEAVMADSTFGRAQSALGWAHMLAYEQGDRAPSHIAEARTRVQKAVSLVLRNPEAYRVWGVLELSQGQFDKAIERFEQAVGIAPSDVESQRRLASAYVSTNQPDAALKAANRAVMDDPWVTGPYTTLGQVHQFIAIVHGDSREDYKAALQSYEQGMKFAPDRSEYGSMYIADILLITQQPDRALSLLVDRLARARQDYRDLYVLGRVEQLAGRPKAEWQDAYLRALGLLRGVTDAHPEDAEAHSQVALVHTRLGEFRDAIAANQRALKLAPADPAVLYNTARMYAMQNDRQQAKEYLAKAVDRYYSLPDILDRDLATLHSEPDFVKIVTR